MTLSRIDYDSFTSFVLMTIAGMANRSSWTDYSAVKLSHSLAGDDEYLAG